MKKILAIVVLGLAVVAGNGESPVARRSHAPAMKPGISFVRAANLQRGINLSMWYAQARDYSAERLGTYTTVGDFKLVKALGFDHVRLSINPEPLMLNGAPETLDAAAIARLDKTVAEITNTGLVVVLDIHPEMPYVEALGQGKEPAAKFLTFWTTFATHFAKTDPAKVYFEVLNEPHMEDSYRWAGIQSKAIPTIRAAAPKHTIIATGNHWGGVDGLLELEPVPDPNVIYSFHDYDPMTFTHQGASWSSAYLKTLRGVPYPVKPGDVAQIAASTADDQAKAELMKYGEQRWDAELVDKEISMVAAWSTQHGVPVWCGEFGAYKAYSDPAARTAWLHDMRVALEAHAIGWSMWDYQGSFALVTKENGRPEADPGVVAALGLHEPRP